MELGTLFLYQLPLFFNIPGRLLTYCKRTVSLVFIESFGELRCEKFKMKMKKQVVIWAERHYSVLEQRSGQTTATHPHKTLSFPQSVKSDHTTSVEIKHFL